MQRRIRSKAGRAGKCYRRGEMNKTEQAYAEYLDRTQWAGEILEWKFERIRFILAPKTTYTPDFYVIDKDGFMEFHEVKGCMEEDANVKLKTANDIFPFKFKLVKQSTKKAQREGADEWIIKEL